MGYYDKKITAKKAISWTTILVLCGGIIGAAANMTQILDWFNNRGGGTSEPPVSSEISSLPLTIEPQTELTTIYEETEPPTEPITEPTTSNFDYLSKLKVVEEYALNEEDMITDSLGNQHIGNILTFYLNPWASGSDGYATYYLGGQYKTLSGTIAVADDSCDSYAQLYILADDTAIYSETELGRKCVPFEFSVNVENCQWLNIKQSNCRNISIILDNWKLER